MTQDEDPIIASDNLDKFLKEYGNASSDMLLHTTKGNKAIGLLIYQEEVEEYETGEILEKAYYKLNETKKPNVDLLSMSDAEKKIFHEKFPNITVNPKYSRPLLFFWPAVKTEIDKDVNNIAPYYIEKSHQIYANFFLERICILVLTWFFGLNATLLAIRGRNDETREYDFPTNKYFKPYTKIDKDEPGGIKKIKSSEHGGHYHDETGIPRDYSTSKTDTTGTDIPATTTGNPVPVQEGGGSVDKLNEFFDNLEKNIDNGFKEQKGGGVSVSEMAEIKKLINNNTHEHGNEKELEPVSDRSNMSAADVLNVMLEHSSASSWDKLNIKKYFTQQGLEKKDFPGMVSDGNDVKGPQYSNEKLSLFGMVLDYKDGERYRITQSKINSDSGGDGWEKGEWAFASKGPDAASSFFLSKSGPKFQQFYSYVMRNSSRTVNQIFNFIFKKMGKLMGNGKYNNLKMKIFIAIHVFAILSFLINISKILTISFIIVLVWILKYAFMSKYSGPGALTTVFDLFGFGSFLLRNLPFGGLIFGIIWFLIPNLPFFAALTIPFVITFKTWFFYLFGYFFHKSKYGRSWIGNNLILSWPFFIFEILLLNTFAIQKYWPHDNKNPFMEYLMVEGFGKAIPAGAMLALFYSEWKANGADKNGSPMIKSFLFLILCTILTYQITKFN